MSISFKILATAAALLCAGPALAQSGPPAGEGRYPAKPVRVIVPYPPGGPTDVIARLVANHLSDALGQQFYVENLAGASGVIGMTTASRAPGDGYTLLVTTNDLSVLPATQKDLAFDPAKNFAAVSIIAATPQVVVTHPSVPANSIQELIALVKAHPEKYNYAAMGLGYGQLSSINLVELGLGLKIVRVPFSGAAPLVSSVLAGHTPIATIGLPPVAPHVKAGKLKLLAVTGKTRSPAFPDVPTFEEAGIPDQHNDLLIAAVVPAGTPRAIIDLLQREIAKAVATPDVKQRLDALGFNAVASTPEDYAALIQRDLEFWPKVVRDANIKLQ